MLYLLLCIKCVFFYHSLEWIGRFPSHEEADALKLHFGIAVWLATTEEQVPNADLLEKLTRLSDWLDSNCES